VSDDNDQDERLSRAERKIIEKRLSEARPIARKLRELTGEVAMARTFAKGMQLPHEVHVALDEIDREEAKAKKAAKPAEGDDEGTA
jgi:ubiquinone biosynthesis protein COQ9